MEGYNGNKNFTILHTAMLPVYFFDPTIDDTQSKVRGVGRYVQQLRLLLEDNCHFVPRLSDAPFDSILIHPFFHLLQDVGLPLRRTRVQIAVMHDIIVHTYPTHFPIGAKGALIRMINRLDLNNYQHIITDSQTSKSAIMAKYKLPEKKIHVLYPPVPQPTNQLKSVSDAVKELARLPYIIYVGDVTWNKNIVNIAEAVKKLPIRIIWVGRAFTSTPIASNPWHREFAQWKKLTYKDPQSVTAGYISDAELTYLYEHAVCNVLTSRDEGFGYSYAEAGRCATPSVLADRPIFHETAKQSALFADPEDPEEIAAAIEQLMHDQKLRDHLGQAAKKRSADFDPAVFLDQFTDLMRQIQKTYV